MTHSEAYIACILREPTRYLENQVPPEAIEASLRVLFTEIVSRIIDGRPTDWMVVCADCNGETWWPGSVKVSDMVLNLPSTALIRYHADALIEAWQRKRLEEWRMKGEAIIRESKPADAIGQLEAGMIEVFEENRTAPYQTLDEATKQWDTRKDTNNHILTGIPTIDRRWLLDRGGLHIVAGRPGVGKTSFAIWLAAELMKIDTRIFFASAEMTTTNMLSKLYSILCNGIMENLDHVKEQYRQSRFFISDTAGMTIDDVALMARSVSRTGPLGCVFVDYLQFLRTRDRFQSREQQVAHIAGSLKEMAKRLNCPVIALAQLNRQMETTSNPRPKLAHLRESGGIEQHADSVILLYRAEYHNDQDGIETEYEEKGKAEVIIAKQRNRATSVLGAIYDRESGMWHSWQEVNLKQPKAKSQYGNERRPNNYAQAYAD